MRVCQPGPLDLKRSMTSRSRRKVTETLGSAFTGRPIRRAMPETGLDRSGAASGSAAMARAICASSRGLGRSSLPLIVSYLSTIGLSGRNITMIAIAHGEDDDERAFGLVDTQTNELIPYPSLRAKRSNPGAAI